MLAHAIHTASVVRNLDNVSYAELGLGGDQGKALSHS
jgi:hypothetical protein